MRFNGTMRRGLGGTAAAVAAMAALTASQAPQLVAHEETPKPRHTTDDVVWSEVPSDDSYHTELPPLKSPKPPKKGEIQSPAAERSWAEAGIPATVLAAYRKAEATMGRNDPGCRLPWQLLAAIGKVESGHAAGGRVDRNGTTVSPILGPVLDGAGFANIADTDGGAYDGDATYDRAVGPMQFIPSTWAHWGRDGNGDGRRDPNNVYDAALAAGAYLCAGTRDLSIPSDLNRAILSYNHSETYLRTVLSWLEFYRKGIHPVTDGTGPIPRSPGAGSHAKPERPVGGSGSEDDGGGIEVGPQPSPSTHPTTPGTHDPDPSTTPDPDPTDTTAPSPDPTDTGSATPDPSTTPDPDPTTTKPDPGCTTTPTPEPTDTTEPTGSPSPDPTETAEPCTTPTLPPTAD
ncbi:lytic transglycosylase domain-containing protein [Streptomyces drozdowiczii]|uniref:Lytic transglycosylase domain-containing protein n=1 Tax=Streptomyces drozdowiczii TaxID=202862 RepID=A0ABY6PMP4_9ACTN|nr:lytic transglycosylase domain-containing protein [Streptomyces drozdowiczii]MCX0247244.1 lytic transglycosylase domain-containing protein [Streptomyces drozdowiczii]UZK53336.1 lytic transglycosylase domain-containing protein [Streptomyces drozdowiczii]